MDIKVVARNKKAFHDYHIIDRFEAGIELVGSEVKSLREGKANIKESFVAIREGEAFLIGMHIAPYSHTGFEGH
jgi:SsrA-binding protein